MNPHPTLRSKAPDLVEQEIWAFLITDYAAQVFTAEAAAHLGDSDQYSFTKTINIIRRQVLNQAAISPLTN